MDISNPLVYAAPFFIGMMLLEFATSRWKEDKELYNFKDFGASFLIGAGTLLLATIVKVTIVVVLFRFFYELFNPMVDGVRQNIMGYQSFGYVWYVWIACQLLDDFTFYWYHRLSHTIRFLWAAHIPHHSSMHYNFGTGVRIGWIVNIIKPFFYVWLAIIGFHYEMIMICMGIETIYQFQLHTKYVPKLGFLEKIFVTHTQHQVHHSRAVPHLDMNHGGIFSIFDRIFGTYYEYRAEPKVEFGVLHPPESYNPFEIVIHEYRNIFQDLKQAKSLKAAWMYVFGPPGWSEDGSRQTAKELKSIYHNTEDHY